MWRIVNALVLVVMAASACGSGVQIAGTEPTSTTETDAAAPTATAPPATDEATVEPAPTEQPTAVPEPDPTATPPAPTEVPEPTAAPTPTADEIDDEILAEDQALAMALLLDDAVLGQGWTAGPREESETSAEEERRINRVTESIPLCDAAVDAGLLSDDAEILPEARTREESPTYALGPTEVEFTASVYESIERAQAPFTVVEESGIAACFTELYPALLDAQLRSQGARDVVIDNVVATSPPLGGEQSFSYELSMVVTVQDDDPVALRFGVYAARVDRAVLSVSLLEIDGVVDTAAMLAAVDERLELVPS